MPLVVDQLPLWTVGFKLAGLDPDRIWIRIPVAARDWFGTLLEAILHDHLACMTLDPRKWDGEDPELAPFFIRHWIDDIYRAVQHQKFNRKLLRHAIIDRVEFKDWCERRTIPLPEFWFPPGWSEYRYPEEDGEEDPAPTPAPDDSEPREPEPDASSGSSSTEGATTAEPQPSEGEGGRELRPSQKARVACQVIAANIWRSEPEKTIADMCRDERLKLGDASYFEEITVRRWVQEVAPPSVSAKRGRPRKKNPPESD